MKTEIRYEDGYYSLYVDDVRLLDRESFALADRIKQRLDNPELDDFSEATEVARAIRKGQQVRS